MAVLDAFATALPLWLAIGVGILVIYLAGRTPILGSMLRFAVMAALIGAAVLALGQRQRFDPYFAGIAAKLGLSDQRVDGKEVRIRMAPDGHFWVSARIDGIDHRLLVDSGATVTALSTKVADRAGLALHDEPFPVLLQTANGTIHTQTATVRELRFGTVIARNLPVIVSPAFGDMNVLGMNFLSRLKSWRVEDGWLILTPHHPQVANDIVKVHTNVGGTESDTH